jgi:hypothetical protein
MEKIVKRQEVNLFENVHEIMSVFNSGNYMKTKEGLNTCINEWLDNEFYQTTKEQKIEFVKKHFPE